jgi:hypothetical protein
VDDLEVEPMFALSTTATGILMIEAFLLLFRLWALL